jgi:spermidine synthase
MKRVTIQDEYALVLRLFHIQPFGSSLFCEMCGNQAIKTGGSMAFGWGNDSSKARDVDVAVLTKRLEAAGLDLGYYTPSGHKAAFSLPRCIEKLLL